jgi:hypothetical protein
VYDPSDPSSTPTDSFDSLVTPQAPTGPFADLVPAAAAQYGVPQSVLNWVGSHESNWRPDPGSPSSGPDAPVGPWQFKPSTARDVGVDPMDLKSSTFGAARYLRKLFDQTGNWSDAVSHYGTFSSGQPVKDVLLKLAFEKHMSNTNTPMNSAGDIQVPDPTVPIFASWDQPDPSQQQQPPATPPGSMFGGVNPSASYLTAQQPGGADWSSTLLRLAAGFAGKQTIGQGISAAADNLLQGRQQDQSLAAQRQGLALQQDQFGLAQIGQRQKMAEMQLMAQKTAQGYMELGVPPQRALQLATSALAGLGGGNPQTAMPDLSGLTTNGGKATKGDVWIGPDGTGFQELLHPYGPPTYIDTTKGQPVPSLPQGSMPQTMSAYKTLNQDDSKAYGQAWNDATTAVNNVAKYRTLSDLAQQAQATGVAGPGLMAQAQRLWAQNFNPTGNAAVQTQLMSQMSNDLMTARLQMLRGLGQVRNSELKMLLQSNPNPATMSPAAVKAITDYMENQAMWKQKAITDYQAQGNRAGGWRDFYSKWQQDNPSPALDTGSAALTGKTSTGVGYSLAQ